MKAIPVKALRKIAEALFGDGNDADEVMFEAEGCFSIDKDGELSILVAVETDPLLVGDVAGVGIETGRRKVLEASGIGRWRIFMRKGIGTLEETDWPGSEGGSER